MTSNVFILLCIVIISFDLTHSMKKSQKFLGVLIYTLGTAGLEQENQKIDGESCFYSENVLKALRITGTYY